MMAEIAYGTPYILHRTQTAPMPNHMSNPSGAGSHFSTGGSKMSNHSSMGQNSLVHSQGHTSSNYSIQSQPSSRSSDTTQGTTASTLFPPPMPSNAAAVAAAQNGDLVTATDNVMNSVADASSSLFQICVSLRQRLHGVPGFSESLLEEEEDADEDTDPVTLLWRTFRRGYPLMLLYNALRPNQPLTIPVGVREEKKGKAATFKFLQACSTDLGFPLEEMFIISDLYGDDTTGFVKVAKVVNRVLDILVQKGLIENVQPSREDFEQAAHAVKKSQRQHIVSELVTTERTYVQHLELLQKFKHLVEEKGIIPGDNIHDIFLNLNSLLDFQRRFLIRVEQTNALHEDEQNWGKLFVLYSEAFKVYEPYIANQTKCEKTVTMNFPALAAGIGGASDQIRSMCDSPTTLFGFLLKPFQRLSKYPLLLEDLYKKGDLDDARRNDLIVGKEAAASVLARTNMAMDREQKAEAVQELKQRVEDWKGHRVEGFGELLLYGTFTVLKSEGSIPTQATGKEGERQYHVYLFETILLCCKDIDLTKPKNKLSNKQLTDKRGKPKLQLKGRIFMQNVTDLISLAKPGKDTPAYNSSKKSRSGSEAARDDDERFLCLRSSERIFWKGDPSIENFIIRFATEDMMKKWAMQIEAQRRKYRGDRDGRNSNGSQRMGYGSGNIGGTSVTEFEYMRGMPAMENPYAGMLEEEEEDDVDTLVQQPYGGFAQSRNGSSTSLRSRSTTGESGMNGGPGAMRMSGRMPPGGPPPQPGLALRTRELHTGTQSPSIDQGQMDSYFSPIEGSPHTNSSARTSASSGMYPFPRQMPPMTNGWYEEGQGQQGSRFTAPAIARQREPSMPNGGFQTQPGPPPGRTSGRPGMHSAQQMPGNPRNRSASSPDIHNNPGRGPGPMRGPPGPPPTGAMPQPPVPDMPAGYAQQGGISRNHNGSPSMQMQNGIIPPQRGMSPSMQRDARYHSQQMQQRQPMDNFPGPQRPSHSAHPQSHSRTATPVGRGESFSPPPPASFAQQATGPSEPPSTLETPTQLKVKVNCPSASQTLTLVVPLNISYQSLKDRIDAKLQRSTAMSLSDRGGGNVVKLKYLDDDDYVSIQSDEDVQTAFETWREQSGGGMGEVELWCK